MGKIIETTLPEQAFLQKYAKAEGHFSDCYQVELPQLVTLAEFVEAFYTTRLFKLERLLLRLAGHGSSDAQVKELASGQADHLAAWRVEARDDTQILLGDVQGRTCSWLMVEPLDGASRLYFGSAVIPKKNSDGKLTLGWGFSALLGIHRVYSKALLAAARRGLLRGRKSGH